MSKNDAVIKELMAKVEEQKNDLGTKPRGTWVTNGVFKRDLQNFFNINTVTDFSVLAGALGFLMSQEEYFKKACAELGCKVTEFKWDNYTVAEYKEDFKMRVAMVAWQEKKKQLDATTAKLTSLISEDERTSMELENIKKSLGI